MQPEVRNPRWRLTYRHAYISASTQRNCMTPTAISMFSRSRNSTKLFSILCDASGSQKSKMADPQTGNTYISACTQRNCMTPTAISMFSRSRNSTKLFSILCDASESQKSRWRTHKPEILISQPVIIIIIIIIMSLTLVSSSDEDIGGVPSMQSNYSAGMKRCGICMEERRVHCKCVGRNPRRHCAGY